MPPPSAAITDVSVTGTFVSAFNVGSASAATVNGVVFAATGTGTGVFATWGTGEGSITLTTAAGTKGTGNFGTTSGGGTFATLSTAYQNLLNPTAFSSGGPTTLTFNGLTIGKDYSTQIWLNDGTTANAAAGRTVTLSSDSGSNTVILDTNVGNVTGGLGQYALSSFTATATTQVITLTGSPTNVAYLSAVSLRDVSAIPEPSTYAAILGAVSLVGVMVIRRKKAVAAV